MSKNHEVTEFVSELSQNNKLALLKAINKIIADRRLKQREVAEILDIKQPRVSDMQNEKIEKFSLDTLVEYFALLGYQLEVQVNDKERGKPITTKISKVSVTV